MERLVGKRLAVDVSIWAVQAMKAMRDEHGEMLRNAHLLLFFRRICKLLYYRVRPVFVFDGGTPLLKKRTIIARRRQRERHQGQLRKAAEKLLVNNLKLHALHSVAGAGGRSTQAANTPALGTTEAEQDQGAAKKPPSKTKSIVRDRKGKGKVVEINISEDEESEEEDIHRRNPSTSNDHLIAASLAAQALGWQEDPNRPVPNPGKEDYEEGGLGDPTEQVRVNTIDPQVLASLPPSMQLELLEQMREQRATENRERFQEVGENPDAFSSVQLTTYLKNSKFKKQIDTIQKQMGGGEDELKTHRVDARQGQEFVYKNAGSASAGFSLRGLKLPPRGQHDRSNLRFGKYHPSQTTETLQLPQQLLKIKGEDTVNEAGQDVGGTKGNSEAEWVLSHEHENQIAQACDTGEELDEDEQKALQAAIRYSLGDEECEEGDAVNEKEDEKARDTLRSPGRALQALGDKGRLTADTDPHEGVITLDVNIAENDSDSFERLLGADDGSDASDVDKSISNPDTVDIDWEEEDAGEAVPSTSQKLIAETREAQALNNSQVVGRCEDKRSQPIEHKTTSRTSGNEEINPACQASEEGAIPGDSECEDSMQAAIRLSLQGLEKPLEPSSARQDSSEVQDQDGAKGTDSAGREPAAQTGPVEDHSSVEREAAPLTLSPKRVEQSTKGSSPMTQEDAKPADSADDLVQYEEIEAMQSRLEAEGHKLRQDIRRHERDSAHVTTEMLLEVQELLQLFGMPYMQAPMEAEAQCAQLELCNVVDGIISDDSDAFLFGAKTVYRHIFDEGRYAELYQAEDLQKEMKLDRRKLINLALLLGSDYTEGISGVGIVNAYEIVCAFQGEAGMSEFRDWQQEADVSLLNRGSQDMNDEGPASVFKAKHRKVKSTWTLPEDFPSQQVVAAYETPQVDTDEKPLKWASPDIPALSHFSQRHFGWPASKVEEVLDPVMRAYEKRQRQTQIEAFFSVTGPVAKIRSKRIRDALLASGGNEKLILGVAGKDGDVDNVSSPSEKTAKRAKHQQVGTAEG